jgi:hypothetical protein
MIHTHHTWRKFKCFYSKDFVSYLKERFYSKYEKMCKMIEWIYKMRYLDVFYCREVSSFLNQMANTPMQDRWINNFAIKPVNMFTTHMAHPTFLPKPKL